MNFHNDVTQRLDIFYRKSEVSTNDNYIKLLSEEIQIDRFEYKERLLHQEELNGDGEFISICLWIDPVMSVYSR